MKKLIHHIPPLFFKNRLTELTYFTTNKCNMFCKHCFVAEELNTKSNAFLSISEILKMGEYIPHMQRVHLGGGEPFMRQDIAELAVGISNSWKTGVVCIPTNGWFGENILNTIEAFGKNGYGTLRLHFSINSPIPEDMDSFSQLKGSFEKWRKNLEIAKEASREYQNITLVALSSFNEYNQDVFIELIDFLMDDIGVDDFSFHLVRSHGEYHPVLDIKKFNEVIDYFFTQKSKDNALLKAFRSKIRQKTADYYMDPIYTTPCAAATSRVVMSPSGDIYPCEKIGYPNLREKDRWFMGSIRDFDYNITELLQSNMARDVKDRILSGKCHCDHGIDSSLSQLTSTKFKFDVVSKAIQNVIFH